ncbi:MAG: MnhB domain-containing protein [Eubacteriales bacterium]
MKKNSEIIVKMTGLLYPFILLFGFYIILNGHLTPGGGFQGGAVLASVFITRYIVYPFEDLRIKSIQSTEKILLLSIMLSALLFLFLQGNRQAGIFNVYYLLFMNVLIGFKVCCGLTIIFFRFVFYEGGE